MLLYIKDILNLTSLNPIVPDQPFFFCMNRLDLCHHHHHPLFFKRSFLLRLARVRWLPRCEASPHIPEHFPFKVQTKLLLHVIFYTFSPSLPVPAHPPPPPPHFYRPIIFALMVHMPKPSQSTMPHHLSHALNTQKTVQDLTSLPIYLFIYLFIYLNFLSFRDTPHITISK